MTEIEGNYVHDCSTKHFGNHLPFFEHLKRGGSIRRKDVLNSVDEILTTKILINRHRCLCGITGYGFRDLDIIQDIQEQNHMNDLDDLIEKWENSELEFGKIERLISLLIVDNKKLEEENKRLKEHFNGLTPAEHERLSVLFEEAAEVIQVVGKIMRHGLDSKHPDGGPTNRELLEKELGDVRLAEIFMIKARDVSGKAISEACDHKGNTIKDYLHYQ